VRPASNTKHTKEAKHTKGPLKRAGQFPSVDVRRLAARSAFVCFASFVLFVLNVFASVPPNEFGGQGRWV